MVNASQILYSLKLKLKLNLKLNPASSSPWQTRHKS